MIDVDVSLKIGTFNLEVAFKNDVGITALFGQSGSGKSLTFSLLSGLRRPDRGRIILGERFLVDTERRIFVPTWRRRIGLVFQDSNLFPHLSVKQNLAFGRWFSGHHQAEIKFDAVVETLGIGRLLKRRPVSLSGGERQRVAIGRALLSVPSLLLFDEPLAALDMERKLEILPLIERLRDEFKIPMVYVSHAIEEVVRLASFVVVIERGKVKAIGGTEVVFGTAAIQLAEDRFDRLAVLPMHVIGENAAYGLTKLEHPSGIIWLAGTASPVGKAVGVAIKATDVILARELPQHSSVRSILAVKVHHIEVEGALAMVDLKVSTGEHLFSMVTRLAIDELNIVPGDSIFAMVKSAALDERQVSRSRF